MTLRELKNLFAKIVKYNGPEILDYDVQIEGCFYGCDIGDVEFEIDHDAKDITIK